MSMLGRAEKSGIQAAPLCQIALLILYNQMSLAIAALNDTPLVRRSLAIGSIGTAAIVLCSKLLGRPDLKAIASNSLGNSSMTDLILLVASCVVWRGQTPYEATALYWFRVIGTAAAAINTVGSIFTAAWFKKQTYLLQGFVTITQLAGGAAQLFLASLLFPHAPKSQFVYTVPLFLISGFATQFFWDIALKPEVTPTVKPSDAQDSQPKPKQT